MVVLSRETHLPFPIIDAVHNINEHQRKRFAKRILKTLPPKATVCLWGLSFKPKTDDMREAPSIDIIHILLKAGHHIRAYDPVAMKNAKRVLPKEVTFASSPLQAAKNADVVLLLTEWDQFRGVNFAELKNVMKGQDLFDGRNVYDPQEVLQAGLIYHGIGI